MEPTSGKLRCEVEVDESFIGGVEEGLRGRETLTKAKVIIAVERRGKRMAAARLRMRRISDFNTDTLIGFIEEVVEPGATIVTDGLPQYRAVARHGYVHNRHVVGLVSGGRYPHHRQRLLRVPALLATLLQRIGEHEKRALLPGRERRGLDDVLIDRVERRPSGCGPFDCFRK
jgi:hypothetical protein